jgi:hypothetical protein
MKKLFLVCIVLIASSFLFAQTDTLPKFTAVVKDGVITISWLNTYKNVSQLNIQRSKDSLKNFSTIYSVPQPNSKTYNYIDKTAKNDSGFYRIFILFEGSSYIFTPSKKLFRDTTKAVVIVPVPVKKEEEKIKEKEKEKPKQEEKHKEPPPPPKPVWVPSVFVFTGNEGSPVIKLPDAGNKKYSIKFMKEDGSLLFYIPQIKENFLTLDKVNFLKSGWYYFELMEDGKLKEKNKFLITKDY